MPFYMENLPRLASELMAAPITNTEHELGRGVHSSRSFRAT
jgi:hypothetical protein